MKKHTRLAALLFGWLLLAQSVAAQAPSLTRGPYLQSTTRDSVIVVWQTDTAGDSFVEYGESDYGQSSGDAALVTTHVVTLTGLSAGATYQYQIKTGGVILHQSTLATAPDPGGDFDFGVFGDSGTGLPAQFGVAAQMLALQPDFLIHTGDVIYPGGQAEGYDPYFFAPYKDLLDHTPIFPTPGNHDYITSNAAPYLDVFHLPSNNAAGTERYYSFDWGDAHFVALDSNQVYPAPDAAMLQWLDDDLAGSTAKWKFVFFHHAPYTSGPHGDDGYVLPVRDALGPIFEGRGVDIVFNGHDHDYERSMPRRDYAPDQPGVIYIVSGGGGASLYSVSPGPHTAFAASAHHAVQVRRFGCILSLRAIDIDGQVIDQIALAKCPYNFYLPIILKQ